MSDEENQTPIEPDRKGQVKALLTLLPVLGILWVIVEYMPKLGEMIGGASDRVLKIETEEVSAPAPVEEKVETAVIEEAIVGEVPAPIVTASPDSFEAQILEQLGGPDRVEVRHLAVSDDEESMVAALKILPTEGAGELVEVFFERDEFGRYLSKEGAPIRVPLKLWP